MVNKKQRNKLKKKLKELGVEDYITYPVKDGYRLRYDGKIVSFNIGVNGLTKKYMEALIGEVKKLL